MLERIKLSLGFQICLFAIVFSNQDEKRLLSELFKNYSNEVRPVRERGVLYIDMSYVLVSLNSMNEKDQIANTFGWLQTSWTDEYLRWNKSVYSVDTLVVDADKVWLPDLIVRNSADTIYGELFKNDKYKVILRSDGNVYYSTAGTASTLCSLDMTYFPYDLQVCYIHIDSWTYSVKQMKIRRMMKKVNLTSYRQNGIWHLLDTNVSDSSEDGSSQIKFIMYWKRFPAYQVASLVLPCSMMSFITLFVFLLPPDSGEKISLSITALLSFTVFQISVNEKMPERSDNRPLITIYILGVMLLTSLSLLCTIIVLMLHYQNSSDPPPHWLKVLVLDWLGRLFFKKGGVVNSSGRVEAFLKKRLSDVPGIEMDSPEKLDIFSIGSKRKRKSIQSNNGKRDSMDHQEPDVTISFPDTLEITENEGMGGATLSVDLPIPDFLTPRRLSGRSIFNFRRSKKGSTTPTSTNPAASPNDCVKAILKKMMDDANSEELKTQWMRIALVCDRFFGILFALSLFILTATIFGILNNPPGLDVLSQKIP